MIPKEIIDEIKSRADITEVISDFVTLKKSGLNYKAFSPFTNEKTPSFYVVPGKGIFKDFSSGKGGDAITFIMEHEGMGYVEALRYLAKKYGIAIDEENSIENDVTVSQRDSLYIAMNYASQHFHNQLLQEEEGISIGLSYFKERMFTTNTIEKFGLGYAKDSWQEFFNEAKKKGYSTKTLEQCGLIVKRDDGGFYDRFRGRVIFPIHNLSGKVIAFGARILSKAKDQPKYLNSPESLIYHKSDVLYGLFQAKNEIRRLNECYLVEGYTDVISLFQAGICNVVSSSGTSLTIEQIRLIKRFTSNITILYDGDAAGIRAAMRGIDLALKEGLHVRVVSFPDGHDPDSYCRSHSSGDLDSFLKTTRKDFISFKLDILLNEIGNDPIKKSGVIHEIMDSINLVQDNIERSLHIKNCAFRLDVDEQVLYTELNKKRISEKRAERDISSVSIKQVEEVLAGEQIGFSHKQLIEKQEREIIRVLINYTDAYVEEERRLIDFFINELEDVAFTHPVYYEIFEFVKTQYHAGKKIDSYLLLENGNEQIRRAIIPLLVTKESVSEQSFFDDFVKEEDDIPNVAMENVLRLKFRVVQKMIAENLKAMREDKDPQMQDVYFSRHIQCKEVERQLADLLGITVAPGGN